jgi:alpha-ketoglutarate-dependent taurine dioxygenase
MTTTVMPELNKLRRKAVSLSTESLVKTSQLYEKELLPLVVEPSLESVDLAAWAALNREWIEEQLLKHGGILFRGFELKGVEGFEGFARAISPQLLDYKERAAPRVEVGRNIYTSTDDRKVFERIDPKIKETFMRKRVRYVRNYGEGVDLSWQDVFQTTDKAQVEAYCRQARTEFEWKSGDRLRTRQVRQAVATHPKTGETVWFNHAHMFHLSNLEPVVRESLLSQFKEEDLPRNVYYGDGSPIEQSVLDEIRGIYNETAKTFPWREGNILMLDNFLASHGREPFIGPRRIVVAMAELYTNS